MSCREVVDEGRLHVLRTMYRRRGHRERVALSFTIAFLSTRLHLNVGKVW